MGKKKRKANYDKSRLRNLAAQISRIRKPTSKGGIPAIKVDMEGLEEALLRLEKKEREVMEKFWGLIPGTPDHSAYHFSAIRKTNNVAHNIMADKVVEVIRKLISFEYLYLYDKGMKNLVDNILAKINKKGVENISDVNAVKYLIIFLVFISGGPHMVFEMDNTQINLENDAKGPFDDYSLLQKIWVQTGNVVKDGSINLKLIIELVEMFDIKDVITMKRFVRLPIDRKDEEIKTEEVHTFKDIRLFKEKIFPYGNWEFTNLLIYYGGTYEFNLEEFGDKLSILRSDWSNIKRFATVKTEVNTSAGTRELQVYQIGGVEVTDIYELMFLCVSRNWF